MVKFLKIALNILVGLIGALAIILLIGSFGLIPQFKTYVVQSGSMEPAVKTGSVVLVARAPSYNSGDIISFKNGNGKDDVVTHRVVYDMSESLSSQPVYLTKGDANPKIDQAKVKEEQIVGKVFFSLPFLGYFTEFVKKPYGFILFVVIPATIIVYEELKTLKRELLAFFARSHLAKGDLDKSGAGMNKLFFIVPILGAAIAISSFSISFFSDNEQSQANTMVAGVWVTPTPSSVPTIGPTPTPVPVNPGDVVINEIMWMGSSVNSSDEWLELRNRTSNTVDLSNWVVENLGSGTNSVTIPQGKSIAPNGYFLIANDPKETGAHNIDPDLVTSIGITNSPSEQLVLRISSGGTIIDTADNSSGGWFAGVSGTGQNPDLSMERNDTPGDGIVGTNWHTATTATNIDAGAPDIATPRAVNSAP